MKKRILLVEGLPPSLRELGEELAVASKEWEVHYKNTGVGALDLLAEIPCDAVVADLRLIDMGGHQLAGQVMQRFPRLHRVILADLGDLQSLLKCVGSVHQFLAKPCEAERLKVLLERAFAFDVWLPNQTVRELVGRMPRLPSPAASYTRLVTELQAAAPSLEAIGELVAEDPAVAAKVLQLANSAAYGPPLDEADPVLAVEELGLENTRGLVLLAHSYSSFNDLEGDGFSVDALWRHSVRTGRFARWIGQAEDASGETIQQAFSAGLLHDIGKLALGANLPKLFRDARQLMTSRHLTDWESEQEIFGATHGEVGACLLATWGLPVPVVEAVAHHHHPTRFLSNLFSPLTAVHVANAFEHAASLSDARARVDRSYLRELGVENRLPRWWDFCHTRPTEEPASASPDLRS
jgi:HD-like signal output (HDOD) protein